MSIYKAIGVMSGTSLDGVDLAYVEFEEVDGKWRFLLMEHESIAYHNEWANRLNNLMSSTAKNFVKTNAEYGKYTAQLINDFKDKYHLQADVVAVHGHTVFHSPASGYTTQIADGAAIAALTNSLVACDFRSMDVALGGQGAPLVPIGDASLFSEYDACINIGGFANISYKNNGQMIAYDIGPANIVLNAICREIGLEYDDKGQLARSGKIQKDILNKLNQLLYYHQLPPKSLGKEWVDDVFSPIINEQVEQADLLSTIVEHIADQVAIVLKSIEKGKILITGGGALNTYLVERIKAKTALDIIIPHDDIIEMKEAIIFAFLGVLRFLNQKNILSEVTGAENSCVSGALYDGRKE